MLRNLGIRSKILAVLSLPVLVLLLGAGVISAGAAGEVRQATQVQALTGQVGNLSELVGNLQEERALSVAVLSGNAEARPALDEVRARVDAELSQVQAALGDVDRDRIDPAAADAVLSSLAAHDQIAPLRSQVDRQALSASAAQTAYTAVLTEDIALPGRVGDTVEDRELAAHLRAYTALQTLTEAIVAERDLGSPSVAAGAVTPEARVEMTTLITRQDVLREEVTAAAALVGARVPALGYELQLARQKAVLDPDGVVDAISLDDWKATLDREASTLDSALQRIAAGASAAAADLVESAGSRARLVVVLAVACVVLPVLLALFLARRITGPLRSLTEAAGQLREELPLMVERMATPGEGPGLELPTIPVRSGDEIGRLAAAFNDVNAMTVQVAREQAALRGSIAAMFVNVARRDQVLLSRQLAFIDQLERKEENPATLDNLFRLDHLATRMRRNAESLLVLAGIDTGRRLRRPMPLSDVIRTASSEIEHYERIDLALRVDPAVVGHVALNTAHLLAELLENATNFSDPASRVVVSTGTGPRGIVVTIVDDGLGMTPEEIADANARVADPPVSEVVGSQRLGFFVVGRLARKLDATISLRGGPARGTIVTIELAPSLFTPGSVIELPSPQDAPDPDAAEGATPAEELGQAAAPDVPAAAGPRAPLTPASADGLPRRGAPAPVPAAGLADDSLETALPRRAHAAATGPVPAPEPMLDAPGVDAPVVDAPVVDVPVANTPLSAARTGGLFSGFRARSRAGSAAVPDGTPPPVAEPERVALAEPERVALAEPELVAEPEPARVLAPEPFTAPVPFTAPEPVAEPEPERVLAPEPFTAPAPEPLTLPAPAPAVSAAALDILPGRAAARAARNARSGFGFTRRSRASAPPPAPAPPTPAEQPAAALAVPVPAGIEAPTTWQAPAPRVPAQDRAEAVVDRTPAPAGPDAASSALQLPPPSLFGTPSPASANGGHALAGSPHATSDQPGTAKERADAPAPQEFALQEFAPQAPTVVAEPASLSVTDTAATAPVPAAHPIGDVLRQRSALASEALTELSRLSTYRPAVESPAPATLARRPPASAPLAVAPPSPLPGGARRTRSASDVRSMLSGFQAGVERGRTSPAGQQGSDPEAES